MRCNRLEGVLMVSMELAARACMEQHTALEGREGQDEFLRTLAARVRVVLLLFR